MRASTVTRAVVISPYKSQWYGRDDQCLRGNYMGHVRINEKDFWAKLLGEQAKDPNAEGKIRFRVFSVPQGKLVKEYHVAYRAATVRRSLWFRFPVMKDCKGVNRVELTIITPNGREVKAKYPDRVHRMVTHARAERLRAGTARSARGPEEGPMTPPETQLTFKER